MSHNVRLDSFIKEFGINETRISLQLKEAQVTVKEVGSKKYVNYDDLITVIKYRCLKFKEESKAGNETGPVLDDKLLTVKEASEHLGVSRSTINRMRENGEIETIMVSGRPRFKKEGLYRTTC